MKFKDAYPSKWLTASDINGDLVVTIRDLNPVTYQEFQTPGKATPDRKPVLYFQSPADTKPLILNKTNWRAIAAVLGSDDTDDWAGRRITLYVAEIEAFGERTEGLRVRNRLPKGAEVGADIVPF